MRHQLARLVVSLSLLSALIGCDAYQREAKLSAPEKPAAEAEKLRLTSLEVFVSSVDQVSIENREIDSDELRTAIQKLSDSDLGCSIVLRAHPNARTGKIIETHDLISESGCNSRIERLSSDPSTSD